MRRQEFLSEDERSIVRCNLSIYFKKYREHQWVIEVQLPGTTYEDMPIVHHWHSATMIVLDIEAHAIYENLLNEPGEA